MNLISKWVWCGGLRPYRCAWVVANGYGTCCCYLLSVMVDFTLLSDIYCSLCWVGRWYLLSTCAFTDPYLYVFFLLIVGCSKRTVVFNSTATRASLHYSGYQGELMLLVWTGSSSSCLDALKFRYGLAFIYFSFLDTHRFSNLRIDVLVVMTSRFWGMISIEFLEVINWFR